MQRARDAILAFGGAEACGPFIRYYLALLGEVPYTSCLAIPPEFGMLPAVIPGSWASIHPLSRAVLTAVSIVWTQRPVWIPADGCNDFGELWKRKSAKTKQSRKKAKWTVPQRFFHILFGLSAKLTAVGYRQRAVRAAKRWLLNNLDGNHGFAGDATATIWTLLALLACGLSEADDSVRSCLRFLNSLSPVDGDPGELGVAKTNVRDTALACRVLGTADCSLQDVAIQRSVDWLLCREVQQPLESDVTRSALAGWSVQGRSADFVDVETTALVLLALREQFTDPPPRVSLSEDSMVAIVRASSPDLARRQVALLDRMAASSRRARQWLVSVQNSDGGWGRFGKCHRGAAGDRLPWCGRLITNDASSPSVTGVVLESISRWEQRRGRATRGAINYLRRTQRPDGNWCDASAGRGPIFATWRVVCGLRAANVDKQDAVVRAAAAWLLGEQCDSGGWRGHWRHPDVADFCAANQDRLWNFGLKSISVIHTSWALLALMAAGHGDSPSVRRGLQFLLDHQQTPGNWGPDDLAAGYRASIDFGYEAQASVHYPLLALATWLGSGPASLVEVPWI
jgi:squalene-hopene/tetraprenyl-beta-curcumene cyclase